MRDVDYPGTPTCPEEQNYFLRELKEFEKQASRYVPGSTEKVFCRDAETKLKDENYRLRQENAKLRAVLEAKS